MRILASVIFAGVCIVACGGSSGSSRPGGTNQPGAGACGVQVFRTPACQQALDSVCCPLSQECARDPGCVQVSQCILSCKSNPSVNANNCLQGCATQSRVDYCRQACAGKGNDCTTVCTQEGNRAEPMVKWLMIADCSKGVDYPEGVTCDDST